MADCVAGWRRPDEGGDGQMKVGQLLSVVHHPQHVNATQILYQNPIKFDHPKACIREVVLKLFYEAD